MPIDKNLSNAMEQVVQSRRRFIQKMTLSATLIPWVAGCYSPMVRPISAPRNLSSIVHDKLAQIEGRTDGRLGFAAIDLSTNEIIRHRADERFAMCSTFKWILAALILVQVDQQKESLSRSIQYTQDDLVVYSPVTKPIVDKHSKNAGATMTIGDLCRATMVTSDNTAANLLLNTVGGPAGFSQRLRALGDQTTRLDRTEPELNENAPGDLRDTTTPEAMIVLMKRFLFDDLLLPTSRQLLRTWMIDNKTGGKRLRAGFPPDWVSGDRTGTSEKNASNNVAFSMPPHTEATERGPLLMVSFIDAPNPFAPETDAIHAALAKYLFDYFVSQV